MTDDFERISKEVFVSLTTNSSGNCPGVTKAFLRIEGVPAEINSDIFSLKEVGYEEVDWINTAKNRDQK
jgi:hypothetical protein